MNDLNSRVMLVLQESGRTKSDFSQLLNVSMAQLSHISSGRNKPGVELLQKVAEHFPEYNAHWLLTGNGDKLLKKTKDKEWDLWIRKAENKLRQLQIDLRELELELKENQPK
jgi:transcriptional regulator with XRE-family HTH domain